MPPATPAGCSWNRRPDCPRWPKWRCRRAWMRRPWPTSAMDAASPTWNSGPPCRRRWNLPRRSRSAGSSTCWPPISRSRRSPATPATRAGWRVSRAAKSNPEAIADGKFASRELAVALLVLLAAAARAGIVAADTRGAGGQRGAGRGLGGGVLVEARLHLARFRRRRVGHVGDALGALLHVLGRLVQLLARLHLHGHEDLGDLVLHRIEQLPEQLEGLALVFLLRLLLRIAAQVDALAQVVQRGQVLAPVRVDALQQHDALELGEVLRTDLRHLGVERGIGRLQHLLEHVLVGHRARGLHFRLQRKLDAPLVAQHLLEAGEVPLLLDRLGRHMLVDEISEAAFAQRGDRRAEVGGIDDLVALLVDELALVVGDFVV